MKHTFHLPVVAALALAGVVLAEPVAEEAAAPVAPPVAAEAALTDAEVIKQAVDLGEEGFACLKGLNETLQSVHDLASADAAAEKFATHLATYVGLREKAESLQKAIGEVGEAIGKAFDAEMESRGITQKDWDAVGEELQLAYLKLRDMEPPFYGSEKLQAVVRELHRINPYLFPEEVEPSVMLDDLLAEIPEELVHQAEAAMDQVRASVDKQLEILKGVKDKETADAAVEQLEALFQERRKLIAEIADSEYRDAFSILLRKETMSAFIEQSSAELDRIMSAEPPFYGSEKLKEQVIGGDADDEEDDDYADVEASATEEQLQKAQAYVDAMAAAAEELISVLEGVTDKESADAAAPKIEEIHQRLFAVIHQVDAEEFDGMWALVHAKSQADDGKAKELFKSMTQLEEGLDEMEPPFYGSGALKKVYYSSSLEEQED